MPADESEVTGGFATIPGTPVPSGIDGANDFDADSVGRPGEGQCANCGGATFLCGDSDEPLAGGAVGAATGASNGIDPNGMETGETGALPACCKIPSGPLGIEGISGAPPAKLGTPPACGFSLYIRDAIWAIKSGEISSTAYLDRWALAELT
jgi:hypothetical protein